MASLVEKFISRGTDGQSSMTFGILAIYKVFKDRSKYIEVDCILSFCKNEIFYLTF